MQQSPMQETKGVKLGGPTVSPFVLSHTNFFSLSLSKLVRGKRKVLSHSLV